VRSPYALKIYIDGSFRKSGYKGGFAGIAEFPEDSNLPTTTIFQRSYNATTNNRMELAACIEAMKYVFKEANRLQINHVIILTDSLYVHDNQHRCIIWKKNKWKNRANRPMENADLWDAFLKMRSKASSKAKVEIGWLRGKTVTTNVAVDRLAKIASAKLFSPKDQGFRSGRVTRSKSRISGGPILYPADNQEVNIRVYRDVVIRGLVKVTFAIYDPPKDFTDKYFAYTAMENLRNIHRGHYYKVKFNNDPRLPMIEHLTEFST